MPIGTLKQQTKTNNMRRRKAGIKTNKQTVGSANVSVQITDLYANQLIRKQNKTNNMRKKERRV
jgi:hypothetical protein